jgi:hypothetical protein
MKRIVLLAGFEAFNADLYRKAAERAIAQCSDLEVMVFSDRDLAASTNAVDDALANADAFFASLLFDFDQVEWLRQHAAKIPVRLVFESAIELMQLTCFGHFTIGGSSAGIPRPIQALLAKFGSGREEDKLAGYLGFLKVGPKLLRFLPSRRAQDLRHWLILYRYWNAGGLDNVTALFLYLARHGLGLQPQAIPPLRESPDLGLCHPDHEGYFANPRDYLSWFHRTRPQSTPTQDNWPVVGLLLYRKHVITGQPYIPQLIRAFEAAQLVPLPVFINGVEGHMAVRDWMTSASERAFSGERRRRPPPGRGCGCDRLHDRIPFGGRTGRIDGGRPPRAGGPADPARQERALCGGGTAADPGPALLDPPRHRWPAERRVVRPARTRWRHRPRSPRGTGGRSDLSDPRTAAAPHRAPERLDRPAPQTRG